MELLDRAETTTRIAGVVIGVIVKMDDAGIFVDYPGNPAGCALSARSITRIGTLDAGHEVVLLFEEGRPEKPIIVGCLQEAGVQQSTLLDQMLGNVQRPLDVKLDGETMTLAAEKEVVIRCGKASITLTRAGKVLIRGTYVLSRSSGANRIKGGSVQIN